MKNHLKNKVANSVDMISLYEKTMKIIFYLFVPILFLIIFYSPKIATSNQTQVSKNNNSEMDTFIDDLIQKMTLDEKIGQTVLFSSGSDITGPTIDKNFVEYLKEGMLGAVFSVPTVKTTIELQKIAVEETRLGIPLLFGYDVIHGHKTIFPISLG
ncbi:hypothetical protein [Lutibacter sp.]|uniref:hypothetical protein n=1 Tax=Lutibacter sp. TaxID=1925666 RepID=UPI00352400CD